MPEALDIDADASGTPFGPAARRRLAGGLALAWLVFWVLMAWVAVQDHHGLPPVARQRLQTCNWTGAGSCLIVWLKIPWKPTDPSSAVQAARPHTLQQWPMPAV